MCLRRFNSLQEVGFISTLKEGILLSDVFETFQFLTGSRFHFYLLCSSSAKDGSDMFQFLTGSRFHFYVVSSESIGPRTGPVSIPYRK